MTTNLPLTTSMRAMAEYYGYATVRAIELGLTCDIKELAIAAFRAAACIVPVPETCEACGYATDDLTEVPDIDPAVGYEATLKVCQGCIAGTVFHVEHPTEECGPLWAGVLSADEVSEIAPF